LTPIVVAQWSTLTKVGGRGRATASVTGSGGGGSRSSDGTSSAASGVMEISSADRAVEQPRLAPFARFGVYDFVQLFMAAAGDAHPVRRDEIGFLQQQEIHACSPP